jgi:hypothetical protein
MKRLVPFALVVVLGCASYSNRSTVMDVQAFPPGHYGLYERKSEHLVLTCELRPGETFGFEYTGKRANGLKISRMTDERDESREEIWRLPLSLGDYEWKPIDPAAVVSSRVPRAR